MDEEGRDLGNVPLEHIMTAGDASPKFSLGCEIMPRLPESQSFSVPELAPTSNLNLCEDTGDYDSGGGDDDFQLNDDNISDLQFESEQNENAADLGRTVITSSKVINSKTQKISSEDAVKR